MTLYKDAAPAETIARARKILFERVGLSMREHSWGSVADRCYWVRLEPIEKRRAGARGGSTGKGVEIEYALASGYAEFLERISTTPDDYIQTTRTYGLMPGVFMRPDEKLISPKELREREPWIFDRMFEKEALTDELFEGEPTACAPFYDVQDRRVAYLPIDWMRVNASSNGLCAGNTPEEALVQGICEVFERYATCHLFDHGLEVPTIPLADIEHFHIYPVLQHMRDLGFQVLVKDCTIGGQIPVLAIAIIDAKLGSYHMHFGSAPTLDIAVQRCVTEYFQGVSPDRPGFLSKMKPILWGDAKYEHESMRHLTSMADKKLCQRWRQAHDGLSQLEDNFFWAGETTEPKYQEAFEKAFTSCRDSLRFVTDQVTRSGHRLYIRDASFLGFPCFWVYIPGMNERQKISPALRKARVASKVVRKVMLSLDKATEEDIRECIESIGVLTSLPTSYYPDFNLAGLLGILTSETCDFNRFYDTDFALTVLNLRLGEYEEALACMQRYTKPLMEYAVEKGADEETEYYQGVMAWISFLARGMDRDRAKRTLAELFGESVAAEVIEDIVPEKAFTYQPNPACGDCGPCPIKDDCYHEETTTQMNRIRQEMEKNPIDQMRLGELFS